jgi:hypothetical protein
LAMQIYHLATLFVLIISIMSYWNVIICRCLGDYLRVHSHGVSLIKDFGKETYWRHSRWPDEVVEKITPNVAQLFFGQILCTTLIEEQSLQKFELFLKYLK